jgi:ABC-type polysaccharide/polyol phosphate export permease
VLQLLFYATPIIYPLEIVPNRVGPLPTAALIRWNPLTQFCDASRSLFYGLELPSAGTCIYLLVVSVFTLLVGSWIFNRTSANVVEEL